MFLIRYAARNLTRQKVRSVLTTAAVAFAVGLVVLGNTFINGLGEHTLAEFTRFTGHVQLRHADYDKEWRFAPLDLTVNDFTPLREKLTAVPGVVGVLGRIEFSVMVQYTDESTIVPEDKVVDESTLTDDQIFGRKVVEVTPALGVEPSLERARNRLQRKVIRGSFFSADDAKEVVIGAELARRLNVDVGRKLEIVSFREGIFDAQVTVVGVMDTGSKIENRLAYLPLGLASQLVDLGDSVTQVQVFGDNYKDSSDLRDAVKASGVASHLAVKPWNEVGIFRTIVTLFDTILGFMLVMIVLVAAVGLLNTMLMTVMERQREIGILMALGVTRWRVIGGFLAEATLYGLVGCIIGGLGGVLGSLPLVEHGITLGADNMRGLPMAFEPVVYGILSPAAVGWAIGTGFVVALLGAFWPSFRASRIQPVEAMRKI